MQSTATRRLCSKSHTARPSLSLTALHLSNIQMHLSSVRLWAPYTLYTLHRQVIHRTRLNRLEEINKCSKFQKVITTFFLNFNLAFFVPSVIKATKHLMTPYISPWIWANSHFNFLQCFGSLVHLICWQDKSWQWKALVLLRLPLKLRQYFMQNPMYFAPISALINQAEQR